MKNRKLTALLLSFFLLVTMALSALAADSIVTFEGLSEGFTFSPGGIHTQTELFDNFKAVMPGDNLTESIRVINNADDCDYVKIYLRAEPHDETENPLSESVAAAGETVASMHDFLAQLYMRVYNGDALIYEASPDQTDGHAENVLLGTYRNGEFADLSVELEVPVTLGNEYARRTGEVDWVFTVEGYDDVDPEPEDPCDGKLIVHKIWNDCKNPDRPDSVTVLLRRNGWRVDEVELNAENQWTYVWDNLDRDAIYTVQEYPVPDGYAVTYVPIGNIVNIINTLIPDQPEPPETDTEPVDPPVTTEPVDTETEPVDPPDKTDPVETETEPVDPPVTTEPVDTETEPVDPPVTTESVDTETEPVDPPVTTEPVDTETEPVDPPVTTEPVDTDPVDPPQTEPVDPPVTTVPDETEPADPPQTEPVDPPETEPDVPDTEPVDPPVIIPPEPPVSEPVTLTVIKAWAGDEDTVEDRPDRVAVTLYNGTEAIETVWLGEWNNWTYTWNELDGNGEWSVLETQIPAAYTPSYSVAGDVVTITNTASLIQTGQVMWPIPVFCVLGILLIGTGIFLAAGNRRRKSHS